jgi:hypothetical protein
MKDDQNFDLVGVASDGRDIRADLTPDLFES